MSKAICHISTALLFLFACFPYGVGAQIAPGVQQSAAQTANITGTVTREDGTPVASAEVRLIGLAVLVTKSDAHGTFAFTSVPYGTYNLMSVSASLGTASRNLAIKGDVSVVIQYIAQNNTDRLKTIARVTTKSSGAQINVTSANIASISPTVYAFEGNTSWKRLLDQIPGVTVGGQGAGASFSDSIADAPFQPVVLSINGALPYETSTTLDGMPINNSSYVNSAGGGSNLSLLPMTAFDTADIVRGPGANAPSIVDSIGGSFVLHAPGEVDVNHYAFSLSNDPYGGIISNVKASLRLGRLSATIVYGINTSPGPLGTRSITPANALTPQTINGQAFLGCFGPSGCSDTPQGNGYVYCYCTYENSLLYCCVSINTHWVQYSGALGLSYRVAPTVTAQLFYAGSSSGMQLPSYQYPVSFMPGPGYSGSIAPGQYTLTYFEGPTDISQASSLLEEKITAYWGRGVLRLAALQDNSFSHEVETQALPDGQYTLWGTGYYSADPSTPVNFNGTSANLTFIPFSLKEVFWSNDRDLLANYTTQIGTNSNVGISFVSSYYNSPNEVSIAYGPPYNINIGSTQSTEVSETTRELSLRGETQLSDRFSFQGAWYFARGSFHVPDPNSPTTWTDSTFPYSAPRLSAVWRPSRDIAVRAALGGSYALPPLYELVGQNFLLPGSTYYEQLLTNLNLQPERSFGFDVGTDIRFHRDTVLSFDVYRTNLYGQFFLSTALTGTFNGLPLYTQQYGNLSQSRYEGINLDIRHDTLKGIYWHGALGLTRAYVISVPAGFYDLPNATNATNTYIVPGINFDGQYQSAVPYATAAMQLGYRWNANTYVDLSPTYYGNNNAYFRPAFVTFDAHAGYSLSKNMSLLATFRNITGIYGQNYALYAPTMAAPTVAGPPYALFGLLYGPRAVVVTANFNY